MEELLFGASILMEARNSGLVIIIKLIDQQKLMQLGQKGIESSYKSLVNIITKLYKDEKK